MESVLALQKLSDALRVESEQLDSDESICCDGSTKSYENCCNVTIEA